MCAGALQSHGIPAMPVGQPGHCAMAWLKPNFGAKRWDWKIWYGGWEASYRHARIQTPWLGSNWMKKVGNDTLIWSVFAYDYCLRDINGYAESILDNFNSGMYICWALNSLELCFI